MDHLATPPIDGHAAASKRYDRSGAPRKRQLLFDSCQHADEAPSNSSSPDDITPLKAGSFRPALPSGQWASPSPFGTPTSIQVTASEAAAATGHEALTPISHPAGDKADKAAPTKENAGDVSVSRRLDFSSPSSTRPPKKRASNEEPQVAPPSRSTTIPDAAPEEKTPLDESFEFRTRQPDPVLQAARAVTRFPASSDADGDELQRWARVHHSKASGAASSGLQSAREGSEALAGKRKRELESSPLRQRPSAAYHSRPAGSSRAMGRGANGAGLSSRLGALSRGQQLAALASSGRDSRAGAANAETTVHTDHKLEPGETRSRDQQHQTEGRERHDSDMNGEGSTKPDAAAGPAGAGAPAGGLPREYEELRALYAALELCCSLLRSRRLLCTFEAVRPSVEDMTRRRFTKRHLAKVLHVAQLQPPPATESTSSSSRPPCLPCAQQPPPLLRLEPIHRAERDSSPVKHAAGAPSAAARFGRNTLDLRIVFLPPQPAEAAQAAPEKGTGNGGVGESGEGDKGAGERGSGERGAGRAEEATEGRAGMLWRTEEFRRRLVMMAAREGAPASIPEAPLPEFAPPSLPSTSTATPAPPPFVTPSRPVRSHSPPLSRKPAASQRFGRLANPSFGDACRTNLRAELARAYVPPPPNPPVATAPAAPGDGSRKENVAQGGNALGRGEEGQRQRQVGSSPLHAAVPHFRAPQEADAGAVTDGRGKGKEGEPQGPRKALFGTETGGGGCSTSSRALQLFSDANGTAPGLLKEAQGRSSGEGGAECSATWPRHGGEEEEDKERGEGGGPPGELDEGVSMCVDGLEGAVQGRGRDDDAGSTSDEEILHSLPQALVQSVQAREEVARQEDSAEARRERKRRMRLGQLPLLMEMLVAVFAAARAAVLPHRDLVTRLVATHCKETNQVEIEEQILLLGELAPDWLLSKPSLKGDRLYRLSKTVSIGDVRRRIFQ